jgi:hypothetical protein
MESPFRNDEDVDDILKDLENGEGLPNASLPHS